MLYITESIINGLRILGFDKETIKKVSREKSLEDIFLSTLFLNYVIVLVLFTISLINGGFNINGRELNQTVFFALLMMYPFVFNLIVYIFYGFFGFVAEVLDKKKKIKPLISIGFHTAIVYSIIIYLIVLFASFNVTYALFLFVVFMVYFIYVMFLAISTIYNYSLPQTLIIIMVPFLVLGIVLLLLEVAFPNLLKTILGLIFA
jgi:hypothetical protein